MLRLLQAKISAPSLVETARLHGAACLDALQGERNGGGIDIATDESSPLGECRHRRRPVPEERIQDQLSWPGQHANQLMEWPAIGIAPPLRANLAEYGGRALLPVAGLGKAGNVAG